MLTKQFHEIRDPLYGFIRVSAQEREILDLPAVQRLRHIHQLALTMLVYPGATHRRFEHSLGVMELAGKIFDVVTGEDRVTDRIKSQLPELRNQDELRYWKQVVRVAALCHDLGHLPFSHAAERDLLPDGLDHEALTEKIILSLEPEFQRMTPPLRAVDVARVAVGPRHVRQCAQAFNMWESLMAEIITGDALGADRMDYLLRDSHHAGVAYGRFDLFRLLDTLRILEWPLSGSDDEPPELAIGVEEGGLNVAEGMALARFFMFKQVYLHPVRRIYDIHLRDFLKQWLPDGVFPVEPLADFLSLTDNDVFLALTERAGTPAAGGSDPAQRILRRQHFKKVYSRNPADMNLAPDPTELIYKALCNEFGEENIRYDSYRGKGGSYNFPVLWDDGRTVLSTNASELLASLPVAGVDLVFARPEIADRVQGWIAQNRASILGRTAKGRRT